MEYFAMKGLTPRPAQVKILTELANNYDKFKNFIIVAPTGVGKTHLALSAAERS